MLQVLCNYGYVQARAVGRPVMYSMTRAGRGRGRDGSHASLVLDSCLPGRAQGSCRHPRGRTQLSVTGRSIIGASCWAGKVEQLAPPSVLVLSAMLFRLLYQAWPRDETMAELDVI